MTAPALALLQVAVPPQSMTAFIVATIIKMLVFFTIYLVGVAMLTLLERKVSAWMQDRHGPNRVGKGWLQPAADGLKNIMKEETYPGAAYKPLFVLAPAMAFIPALLAWAVIPFGSPWDSRWGRIDMALAPLPIGFLFILAVTSIGIYGIVIAGWSSNNKYSLLGGLRSSAQMVSYEISMGMATIPVLLLAGNVSLNEIVENQATFGPLSWHAATATLAWIIFLIAAFAETNRLPFDLPEAESELVAGYHSEYSAMKFSMFFIAEYANMVTASALMATLFFGGWDIPFTRWDNLAPHTGLKTLLTTLLFFVKIMFFIFFYMWIRWTLPRFRYDQLMSLGWKIMLPTALAYIMVMAGSVLALQIAGFTPASWQFSAALFGLNVLVVIIVFFLLDRGRIVSPAYSRLDSAHLERLRAATAARMRQTDVPAVEASR
jgi:NADH-quinone oxidoreductase subunit H